MAEIVGVIRDAPTRIRFRTTDAMLHDVLPNDGVDAPRGSVNFDLQKLLEKHAPAARTICWAAIVINPHRSL
jgi:hypothetical protein